jgi:hypothetical protein
MQQVRTAIRRGEDQLLRELPQAQRRALASATRTISRALR